MFTSKNSMLKINKIHQRTLRVVYDDYNGTYEELLVGHNDIYIHQKHLKHLAIEVYKSLMNLNAEFMWLFFKNKSIPWSLRNCTICILPPARSSHYGINSGVLLKAPTTDPPTTYHLPIDPPTDYNQNSLDRRPDQNMFFTF